MNSSLVLLALFLNNLVWIAFFIYIRDKDDKREQNRFREYILADKSKDINQYASVIPEEESKEVIEQDEMVDLSDVDPSTLLDALRK